MKHFNKPRPANISKLLASCLFRVRALTRSQSFATFWHGPLDPLTFTCLASFARLGVNLQVYSYAREVDLPAGVGLVDARTVVADETMISRFIFDGSPSISKFSNYFRYRLLNQTDACWVDSDIICLKRPRFRGQEIILGYQSLQDGPWALNGAVLKLPPDHAMLAELTERAVLAIDGDTKWGVIGPLLITEMARKHHVLDLARPKSDFYPVGPSKFWWPLLPGYREQVTELTRESTFLHLWHEFYRRSGYDKSVAPPAGSFLHQICEQLGTLGRFTGVYKREEIRALLGPYINE